MKFTLRPTLGADGPYWSALAQGRLDLPRCQRCQHWHWPAVFRCGECGSWEIQWYPVEMMGRIFSYARTWHPFAGSEDFGVPYVSLVVELPQAGGRRVLGVLRGDDAGLRIGAAVRGVPAAARVTDASVPALHWTLVGESS